MKIAILMGSPRKKDSYKVCETIKEEISKYLGEQVEVDYIMLNQLDIKECKGCEQCLIKGEQYCPIKDDLQELVHKMTEADGIILASPVYACQVTGSLKKVVDRLSYLFHRPQLVAKPIITVVTSAGGGIKPTQDYLKLVANGWGGHLVGEIKVVSPRYFEKRWGSTGIDKKYRNKISHQIEGVSHQFAEYMKKKRNGESLKPSLYDVFLFNGLKSKTYTSKADYDYWNEKGWLKQHYYYATKMPMGSKLVEKIIEFIVKRMSKKLGVSQSQ